MKCPCGNLQCYVCSSNVVDYSHFNPEMRCPLYGDMQQILKEQVATAQERTVQELLETRAGLEDSDVRIDEKMNTNDHNRINLKVPRPRPGIGPLRKGFWIPYEAPPPLNHVLRPPQIHRCIGCSKSFYSINSLSQHQRAKQHSDKGNVCITCNKSFHSPDSLNQHQRDKHGHGVVISKRKRKELPVMSHKKRRL